MEPTAKKPLTALIRTIQDGRFLKLVFLIMLGLSVGVVGMDFQQMVANAPGDIPGSQRLEPAQMERPEPGDQTRMYLPKTMPIGPERGKPNLPGYFGPLDSTVMGGPMAFYRGDEGRYSAIGTITQGTAERLQAFLDEHPKRIGRLYLHSPGGSVSDALAMAKMIRTAGISTVVPANGYCASSCPILFSGGLHRQAGKNSWVGVHQIYPAGLATGSLQRGMVDAQNVSAQVQRLLVRMDVDPKVWIYAMQTLPAELYVFRPEELRRLKLANHKRPTTIPKERPKAGI